jgi:leucyl aminopeptidase
MLKLTTADYKRLRADTLLIPVCEKKNIHTDPAVKAVVKEAQQLPEFSGKKDEVVLLYAPKQLKAKRVLLRGLGNAEELDAETLRAAAGNAVKDCIQKKLTGLWVAVPDVKKLPLDTEATLRALMEGGCLANHIFDKFRKEKKHKPLRQITFALPKLLVSRFRNISRQIETVCTGTVMARDWISTPANAKTPEQFAADIAANAKEAGLKTQVIKENQLERQGMGALLSVCRGSKSAPHLVVLDHNPAQSGKPIVLVGKGVTFDSGGLNLKPGSSMTDMKADMSGAAAVAATLVTVARMKTKRRVIGVIPIVENMVNGEATRPGDIVKTYTGKTVEVGNTDAEGRLILIDAMAYAVKRFKPRIMVDLATLTGACVVALGEKMAAVFSEDEELAEAIVAAGKATDEHSWRMPLFRDYLEMLKSEFADINNLPSARWGGAITAALFLSEFVENTRWAHIDIAGPAYSKKAGPYCPPGGTGFGVRLLMDLLNRI